MKPNKNESGWVMHCTGCGDEWEPYFVPADGSQPRGTHSSERTGCVNAPTLGAAVSLPVEEQQ